MDITLLFKACIKTVRATNKLVNEGNINEVAFKARNIKMDQMLKSARDLIKKVKTLEDFLKENKASYLNVINYISAFKVMSELDKQEVDSTAEEIINYTNNSITNLRKVIRKDSDSTQKFEHYSNILHFLEKYLKEISKMYAEMKAVRVKRVLETHKISKLETEKSEEYFKNGSKLIDVDGVSSSNSNTTKADYNNLTIEEMQLFETENDVLYSELNSLSDEVKQMESKVVHIAELQELFTEKVLQQEKDVDRIAATVINATVNVKHANKQIKQAIQRNAGLRIWLLFFLLVISFSLLFLDWYND